MIGYIGLGGELTSSRGEITSGGVLSYRRSMLRSCDDRVQDSVQDRVRAEATEARVRVILIVLSFYGNWEFKAEDPKTK